MLSHTLHHSIKMDAASYAPLLQWCAKTRVLLHGELVHSFIIEDELEHNSSMQRLLMQMYVSCGAVGTALTVFAAAHERTVVMWNLLIRAYAHQGNGQFGLTLFDRMLCEGSLPDKYTIVCAICACQVSILDGKRIHSRMTGSSFALDLVVCNALLNLYAKWTSLEDVSKVFNEMHNRSVVTWTTLISAFAQADLTEDAWRCFCQMQIEGEFPDQVNFLGILSACINCTALDIGKRIHLHALYSGLELDVVLGTALLNMYGNCGGLQDVYTVFEKLCERNVVAWNSLIAIYVKFGLNDKALSLLDRMQQEGVLPDNVSFINSLSACDNITTLFEGKKLHSRSNPTSPLDVVLGTAVMNVYMKCGSLEVAHSVFNSIQNKNVISWNILLGGYVKNGNFRAAFQLFWDMQQEGLIPDRVTFIALLDACASEAVLSMGEFLHSYILDFAIDLDIVLSTAIMNMYGRCGSLEAAQQMFDSMPERNVITWNSMIALYTHLDKEIRALQILDKMYSEEVLPDKVTFVSILDACASDATIQTAFQLHSYIIENVFDPDTALGNALLSTYGKLRSMEDALDIFQRIPHHDVQSWTAMITVYFQHGKSEEAIQCFEQMHLSGLEPIKATFLIVFETCADYSELVKGEHIHVSIVGTGLDLDHAVATSLVNMYGKCGSLHAAQKVFDSAGEKDLFLWTLIITVYAQHGHGKDCICLFARMQHEGIVPSEVTFMSILTACSHGGLVNEGCYFFTSMMQDFAISPTVEHYDCMVDLYGRAGLVAEAENLSQKMPFQPRVVSLIALLGACRHNMDMKLAEGIAKRIMDLDPSNPTPYVMLSNYYAAIGKETEATNIISEMKYKGIQI